METTILTVNWIIYGGLFGTFFLKLTDEKERNFYRKLAYTILMLCTLFFSVCLFKQTFVLGNSHCFSFNPMETIFNGLVLFLMCTKIKEDKIFKRK